ncbi:ATP-binding cassette domain-containing protein [Terasakiella pusilla]|uniref:ATP-binding cassette domain-containing protein n=1 Tax=Terasakiella pusilla TaxID=64973 RepID=UPI003AA9119E
MKNRILVPTHYQTQTTECGLAAMAMVMSHWGRHVSLDELRLVSGVSRDCITAADLIRVAKHYDLPVRVLRREPEDLKELGFPLIVYMDFIHFTVLEDITDEGVWLNDPSSGRILMDKSQFNESFSGITLSITPNEAFKKGGVYLKTRERAANFFKGKDDWQIATSLFLGVLSYIPQVAFAFLTGSFLTQLFSTSDAAFSDDGFLFGAMAMTIVAQILLLKLSAKRSLKLEIETIKERLANLANHLLNQPYRFFVYRIAPVLHQRIYKQERVTQVLLQDFLDAGIHGCGLLLLLGGFYFLDPVVGCVAIVITVCFGSFLYLMASRANKWARRFIEIHNTIWVKISQALENFESFKTGGGDQAFFRNNMGTFSHNLRDRQKSGLYRSFAEASSDFFTLSLVLSLFASLAWLEGETGTLFTGLCLAFGAHKPFQSLAKLQGQWIFLEQQLPSIDDLTNQPHPKARPDNPEFSMSPYASNILTAENITFGFTKVKPALLRDASLSIKPGEQLGITGPSGGGKSTFAETLIGLHQPWSGQVYINGFAASSLSPKQLRQQIGWVNKHPYFIKGTVRDNITLWDETISEADIQAAIKDACLTQCLTNCPEGLDTIVAPQGANFSGGQRQRLEIARALARNPRILVLDEATDGLDSELETKLRQNLRDRAVTLLMISHRESTLNRCDRVVHLINGKIQHEDSNVTPQVAAASPYLEDEEEYSPTHPQQGHRADLIKAFCLVGHALTKKEVNIPKPPLRFEPTQTDLECLESLARYNGLPLRNVRFVSPNWWQMDHGPLIGFDNDQGKPVAILPDRNKGFEIINPSTNQKTPLSRTEIDKLENKFVALHEGFEEKPNSPFRFFFHGFHQNKEDVKATLISCFALSLLMLVLPFAGYVYIDEILLFGETQSIYAFGSALAGLGLVYLFIQAYQLIAIHRLEGRIETLSTQAIYQHMMRIRPFFFHKYSPDTVTRSLRALPYILDSLSGGFLRRLLLGAGVISGLGVIGVLAPRLFIYCLALLGGGAFYSLYLSRQSLFGVAEQLSRRINNVEFLLDVFKSAPRLIQSGREKAALDVWKKARREELSNLKKSRCAQNNVRQFNDLIMWFSLLGFLPALAMGAGGYTPAHLSALLLAFMTTVFCLKGCLSALNDLAQTQPFFQRLKPLVDAPIEPRRPIKTFDKNIPPIEIKHVSYCYPNSKSATLKNVSLTVGPGQIVTLVGSSGCGKSTLLRVLLGFYPIENGEIIRSGLSDDDIDLSSWRERVGAVFQDDQLEIAQTIRGHIMGNNYYTLPEIREAARLAMLEDDLNAMPMGIQSIVDSERVSTGQKQRILIAQRLVRKPMLLILDESTNALPEKMQAELFANIRTLGLSCLLVSHRESAIAASDRVFHMQDGQIVWSGSPQAYDPSRRADDPMDI